MNFSGVAAALRQPEPALLRDPQLWRLVRGIGECGLCNIDNPIFLSVVPERYQFSGIAGGSVERALPVIFRCSFFIELRAAARQVHMLDNRVERVTVTFQ